MKRSKQLYRTLPALFLVAAMLVSSPKSIVRAAEDAEKVSVSLIGKYDSADTAAIRDIDTVRKQIRFRNHSTGKTYTLSYDNTSMIYDARGTALSASLLEVGQIVDVTFLKSTRHITTLNVSKDAWVVENTRDHELVRGDGTAKVKGEIYKIDARTLVMADGALALAEDVLSTDTVTVSGIGKEIYSVMVTGGHGYVSLSSDTVEDHSLVGAWIELDNEVIYKISPNMLLSAPEGDYNLQILGNGASYQSEVNISRNQETVVDTSNVNITKPKEGIVTFEIIPDSAEVFVDDQKMLTDVPQSIRYGYHSLKIMADGYITQNKYLKIGTPKSVISIELEAESGSGSSSTTGSTIGDIGSVSSGSSTGYSAGTSIGDVSSITSSAASTASTVSANSSDENKATTNQVIEGYKLYFDEPYGAELYFDGGYIGMIPTSVVKVSGTHEIILKKDGYETKSYRINVDSDKVDLNYTFPDLVKIKSDDDSSSSSSASSSASSASTDDSSASGSASSADSASTDDSGSGGNSGASTDASTAEDSSAAGGSSSDGSSTADTSGASVASSTADSTTSSEDASTVASSGSTNNTEGSKDSPAEGASTGSSSNKEEASDAASAASGG